jgi:hypothetical protein
MKATQARKRAIPATIPVSIEAVSPVAALLEGA